MRKPLCCTNCGCDHGRKPGAGLYCSDGCQQAHEAAKRDVADNLKAAGFTAGDAPNCFVKDGFVLSIEQVLSEGMDKALARHEAAVSYSRG